VFVASYVLSSDSDPYFIEIVSEARLFDQFRYKIFYNKLKKCQAKIKPYPSSENIQLFQNLEYVIFFIVREGAILTLLYPIPDLCNQLNPYTKH
jgi:hypothetical protein